MADFIFFSNYFGFHFEFLLNPYSALHPGVIPGSPTMEDVTRNLEDHQVKYKASG